MTLFRPAARPRAETRSISREDFGTGGDVFSSGTAEQALRLFPVYAATRLIADSVASLRLPAFREEPLEVAGGGRRLVRRKITQPQLIREPSSSGTRYDWVFRCLTSLLLRGNAFGLVVETDGMGFPTGIEWLNPDEVSVDDNRAVRRPMFRWLGQVIPPLDLVHIPAYTLAGRVLGLSPIQAFALSLDTGLSAQKFGRDFFADGGHPSAILKNEKPVSEDGAKRVKQRFLAAMRGSRDPAVFGGGWEYEAIQVRPEESQFLQTIEATATHIAAIYGIWPPEMIGGSSGNSQTYANVEQQNLSFATYTLRPWTTRFEWAISKTLPERQLVRFNMDDFVRVDLGTRYRANTESVVGGWRTVNEVREDEDLEPVDNGDLTLWPPRRQQLTEIETKLGADDESGQHDPEEVLELVPEPAAEPEPAEPDPELVPSPNGSNP